MDMDYSLFRFNDLEQIMAPLELVKYGLEERLGTPRCELGPAPNIFDYIDELLKNIEELLKLIEDLADREMVEKLVQVIQKLRKLVEKLRKDLVLEKFRQDLERSLEAKTANGVPRKEMRRVRWKELVNGLSNKEILNGISKKSNPKHWLLLKINEYSFLVTIEELGPGLPDSNGD